MRVRHSTAKDRAAIRAVILAAFDPSEREVVARLVEELLDDPTAQPLLSLVAEDAAGRVVAHVLFTAAMLDGTAAKVQGAILAPLAVHPGMQSQGLGGQLVREGLEQLAAAGVELVFVLGHPGYYPRFGFEPAGRRGLLAPYPIAEENADAWMVTALGEGLLGRVQGQVRCADALNRPELWRE